MKKYKVDLISKDGQVAVFMVESDDDNTAVQIALDSIKAKHWDVYDYKLKQLERLDQPEQPKRIMR